MRQEKPSESTYDLQQAQTECMRMLRSGITTGFCEVQGERSMKNGAVAWDGIYGIIHMAALTLQLWILISALCAKGEIPSFFSSRARNWLPSAQPRKIFHLFYTFSSDSFHFMLLIRLRVSCNAIFISFSKSHMFPYITSAPSESYDLVEKELKFNMKLRWKLKIVVFTHY